MRTTLNIDADVLEAAKKISKRTARTTGQVLSDLARQALSSTGPGLNGDRRAINAFEILAANNRVITPEQVQRVMDALETP